MGKLDVYYRGFKNYRKETKKSTDCKKERQSYRQSNVELDVLNSTKFICTIDNEWVEQIEKGLVYVEKAVAEERQFIRTDGETIPIEKVKKVSKHSVEHLAKHSEMITHIPENPEDDIVPDKIYIVEKLSDYAVYENRFLYMLLSYLNDFIYFRLDKIEKLRTTYISNLSLTKEVKTKNREFTFETKLYEKRLDNPYPVPDKSSIDMLQRIKNCQTIVNALLNTNLMSEVSKTPMIKPPITKTNVLKMNNNFKNALALYEYISSYKGLGYEVSEVRKDYNPFDDDTGDEFAEIVSLTSFLAYKYGNDISDILETSYKEEERLRKLEEERKLEEKIKRLRKKVSESNQSMEEYMLLLEKRNKQLIKDRESLIEAREEINRLNIKIDELNLEKEELLRRIDKLHDVIQEKIKEIAYLNQKYIDDMEALKKKHEKEMKEEEARHQKEVELINKEHQEEVDNLNRVHEEEINTLHDNYKMELENQKEDYETKLENQRNDYEEQLETLRTNHLNEIDKLTSKYTEERKQLTDKYEAEISSLNTRNSNVINEYNGKLDMVNKQLTETKANRDEMIVSYENQLKEWKSKCSDLTNVNDLVTAEITAEKIKNGELKPNLDYTSREKFLELEKQFRTFNNFFEEQWKMTKKQIKKEILDAKPEEPKKKK